MSRRTAEKLKKGYLRGTRGCWEMLKMTKYLDFFGACGARARLRASYTRRRRLKLPGTWSFSAFLSIRVCVDACLAQLVVCSSDMTGIQFYGSALLKQAAIFALLRTCTCKRHCKHIDNGALAALR